MISTSSTARDQARIEAEAADWLVRRGGTVRPATDDEAFYAWIEADPRHGATYDTLAQTLEDIGQLKGLADLPRPRARWPARALPALAAAGLAAAALVAVVAPTIAPRTETFATGVAQTRRVTLADGSVATLGARSVLRVRFAARSRHVALESGEAYFEVAHDTARPFYVAASDAVIRVVGTKFDVRHGAEGVRVSVQEGRVEVRDRSAVTLARPAVRVLTAGQATEVDDTPTYVAIAGKPPPVEPVTVAKPGAWRDGRLAYDDAPLAEVVADINRYYGPGVRLANPTAGEVRVTAAFRVNEIPAFLDALATTLPVHVAHDDAGAYRLSASPG